MAQLKLPLVLPLYNTDDRELKYAYQLVFPPRCVIYYSYEHAIGVCNYAKMWVRTKYWNRRRGIRYKHINAILENVNKLMVSPVNAEFVACAEFESIINDVVFYDTKSVQIADAPPKTRTPSRKIVL